MTDTRPDLVALLGSRICHDLISPISAIGNGVELLAMAGTAPGPEMTLIAESVANASARIRFFRLAFGAARSGQAIAQTEITSILDDMTRGGRLRIAWGVEGPADRPEVKLAFLALQCLETALPYGGRVEVTRAGDRWTLAAEAPNTKIDPALWQVLEGTADGEGIAPAHVQFLLFRGELAQTDRKLALRLGEREITLAY